VSDQTSLCIAECVGCGSEHTPLGVSVAGSTHWCQGCVFSVRLSEASPATLVGSLGQELMDQDWRPWRTCEQVGRGAPDLMQLHGFDRIDPLAEALWDGILEMA
jgi:hypothetical protein